MGRTSQNPSLVRRVVKAQSNTPRKTSSQFFFQTYNTFDFPPSIASASKDSPLGFGKFIGRNPFYLCTTKDSPLGFGKFIRRNPFDLCTKPSIFSSPPSSSFSSSSYPFFVENSCAVCEDVVATLTDVATVA